MSNWYLCSEKMPPLWKYVKINSNSKEAIAMRSLFSKKWEFISGFKYKIQSFDSWRELTEEEYNTRFLTKKDNS